MSDPFFGETTSDDEPVSDRELGWRPLYSFFKHRHFTRWNSEDASAKAVEDTCPLVTKLLISHRWETPDDPDPNHTNLPTVVEYLTRAFMITNGLLDRESYLAKELVIGGDLRSAFEEGRLHDCTCGADGWLDVRPLLASDDVFYERVTDIQRRRNFYKLLKHVRVWYDYSSLPQARGTPEEEAFLDRALNHLADIVSQSEVLTLWGVESVSRAWCLFEVLAARTVHFCPPAAATLSPQVRAVMKMMGEQGGRGADLYAYRGRPGMNIMIHVDYVRRSISALSEQEIHDYLLENNIQCTKASDLPRLAGLIHLYFWQNPGGGSRS